MTTRAATLKVWAAALLAAVAAAATAVALGLTSPAQAAFAGDRDASFDGDGKLVFDVLGDVNDFGHAVAIQPDGKIVVAGSWQGFASDGSGESFALARFNPDGSLDTSFGANGRSLVSFPNGPAEASGVAIQPDGKIVAAGWRNDADGVNDADFALARLEPDGDLDPSFSGDGKIITSFGGADYGDAVAIQTNAFPGDHRTRIVVAGRNTSSGDTDFALARYTNGGSLDTSFSSDGKQTTGFGSDFDSAEAIAIQSDGQIVAAGTSVDDCPPVTLCHDLEFTLARYNTNGSLDTSFDGDGRVTTGLGGDDIAFAIGIQADGKITAAGGNGDFALARYNANGSLDTSFDDDGKLSTSFGGFDLAHGVAIQADGKVVAGGWREDDDGVDDADFALARYNVNGSLDPSFSGDGKQITNFGGSDEAEDLAIQADGRIVAAGSSAGDFALARYHTITDNTPPNTTITSGPSGVVRSTSATFEFVSSEPGSKFRCRLDGAAFSACSSPKSYANLNDGRHVFRVRAIDAAGNADPTPAVRSWTVDTTAPRVVEVFPLAGATGVGVRVNVQATFSEAMRAGSINVNTFKLLKRNADGTTSPVAATVSYNAVTKKATLDTDSDLERGARYIARITTGAKDLAGNRLDQNPTLSGNQPKVWRFTVRT